MVIQAKIFSIESIPSLDGAMLTDTEPHVGAVTANESDTTAATNDERFVPHNRY